MTAIIDITGQRFGDLVVLRQAGRRFSEVLWECRCSCGAVVAVRSYNLRNGQTKSCGCLRARTLSAIAKRNRRHGNWTDENSRKDGHATWHGMIARCHNPNDAAWALYGGRGIQVCRAWRDSFEQFMGDMGPRPTAEHSIDRIDNYGNYEPANCRWATPKEQGANRRRTPELTEQRRQRSLLVWARKREAGP